MAVSRRLRYEVLRRDDHACRYCGATAPDIKLTVDHVLPVALGGGDDAANLVTACADCNAGKSSSAPDAPIVADVDEAALRWSTAIKRAGEVQRVRREERDAYIAAFDEAWGVWQYDHDKAQVSRPGDWAVTIARHYDAGLDLDALLALLPDVMPRAAHPETAYVRAGRVRDADMWRYFCGALRNLMTERAEIAAQLIATGDV